MAEQEPRVLTEDVRTVLIRWGLGNEDSFRTVAELAEASGTSTKTVRQVMANGSKSISLDTADRLVIAAGGHLSECRLVLPDDRVVDYFHE
jgi:hypothetical protein